jgi:predicted phosphodiesterase
MVHNPILSFKHGHPLLLVEARLVLIDWLVAIRRVSSERSRLKKEGRAFLDCERPDICVFGHTHQPKVEWFGKTLMFNSGSAGPKRFKLPRCLGILVLARQEIIPKHILLNDRWRRRRSVGL